MQTLWQRIDAQLVRHEQTKCVTPPRVASDEEIFEVEQLLGVKLPDELKLFYQKFSHDWAWRLGRWIIQPLPDLGILTDTMSEKIVYDNLFVDDEQYWNPKWIDFAEDLEGKKFMCLNLDREDDAEELAERIFFDVGEVFEFDIEEGCVLRKGVSFLDWLENLLSELEAQAQTFEMQTKE
ncbi:SMI1/KNR4 family protein [Aetokthonos hydrillicola Thurmond2011]|uniref:SMI1/KNR4 family protein n=2 Tax=Aetokthonos TaxID=1550243 RepID=A0AAP5I5Q1_9CYAN|nr:SMI1/KNR4 family protein [Aetokthonos hydrillicola Thurmond2011]